MDYETKEDKHVRKWSFLVAGIALAGTMSGCGLFAGPPQQKVPAMVIPSPSHSQSVWMHANAAQHTVDLTVIAGYASQGFNLNGTANGAMWVTVPEGWHVVIEFTNDSGLANSLAVVRGPQSTQALFPGAGTPPLAKGISQGQRRTLSFVPTIPGSFRLASLVPGHESSGMWAHFVVTPSGQPSLRL
ncbi:MAG: hypothetical protein C7B44_10560 [Sulfobacillus thermosulfidooxidans]|nr:MAG: hypothetical protein C7B44_10560 [Sulfobacillus thermosulfidooxidans]